MPRLAAALGRILLRRFAVPWILMDADAPVGGLPGLFFPDRAPRYARGPHPVGLGDLAYIPDHVRGKSIARVQPALLIQRVELR